MPATRPHPLRLILLLGLLVCVANMCVYWVRVPGALHAANLPTGLPQATPLTDLYPRWYGTRELLLHHRDPYGAGVSQEIQMAYYGQELNPSLPADRLDEERFAYPLYVIFLMFPTVNMDFDTVRIVAWWLLAGVTTVGIFCWLRVLRVRLSLTSGTAVFAIALTSPPVLQGLTLLQLGLLVACLIAAAAACVAAGRLFLAGALLATATIKPQMCLLPIAWFALWSLGEWKQRKSLALGFGTMLFLLILGAELFLPGWLIRYPKALVAYSEYTHARSFLGGVLPLGLLWIISILAVVFVGLLCWRVRREPADSIWFAIALAFVLALTVTVVPTVNALFNQVLVIPVALLGIRYWRELRQGSWLSRLILHLICGCGFLPWVLSLIVVFSRPQPQDGWYLTIWSAPLYSSFALPVLIFSFLILLCRAATTAGAGNPDRTQLATAGTL